MIQYDICIYSKLINATTLFPLKRLCHLLIAEVDANKKNWTLYVSDCEFLKNIVSLADKQQGRK